MGRSLCIALVLALFAFRSAYGLELAWSTGQRDLSVTSAAPCTLLVRSTVGDSLFQRQWRFVWTGTAEVDTALSVVPAAGTAERVAPTTVATGPTRSDSLARVSVAVFERAEGGAQPTAAMFVLRIHPSLKARLALAPASGFDPEAWSSDTLNCLTINGGSDIPLVPILCGITRMGAAPEASAID